MNPIIGVTANLSLPGDPKREISPQATLYYLQEDYLKFIEAGGGVPVILAPTDDPDAIPALLERLDGVLITGGVDVDPSFYGETNNGSLGCQPQRDSFEIAVVNAAHKREMAVLGICRGMQALSVALGSSLHQHIYNDIKTDIQHHREVGGPEQFHPLQVEDDLLHKLFSASEIRINSSHHQAVKSAGDRLKIIGRAPDGVVEAVKAIDSDRVLGIQWHPERMRDDPLQLKIASWFIAQCSR